jgi:hypothetical protein
MKIKIKIKLVIIIKIIKIINKEMKNLAVLCSQGQLDLVEKETEEEVEVLLKRDLKKKMFQSMVCFF